MSKGITATVVGSTTSGSTDGTGTSAALVSPTGLLMLGTKLYVAENNGIRVVNTVTGLELIFS